MYAHFCIRSIHLWLRNRCLIRYLICFIRQIILQSFRVNVSISMKRKIKTRRRDRDDDDDDKNSKCKLYNTFQSMAHYNHSHFVWILDWMNMHTPTIQWGKQMLAHQIRWQKRYTNNIYFNRLLITLQMKLMFVVSNLVSFSLNSFYVEFVVLTFDDWRSIKTLPQHCILHIAYYYMFVFNYY